MSATISRPAMTDDDGSGTTGTILSKAFVDSILDNIDAMFSDTAIFAHGGGISTLALSTFKVDSAGAAEVLHIKNWNTTNNNAALMVFIAKDAGGTERVQGYFGMQTTDHSSGAIVAQFNWYNKTGSIIMSLFGSTSTLSVEGSVFAAAGSVLGFASRSRMSSAADGLLTLTNVAVTSGVTFRFTTDARCEIRNIGNSDFGDLYAKDGVFSGDIDVDNLNVDGIGSFQSGIEVTGGIVAAGQNGQTFSGTVSALQVQDGIIYAHTA